MKKGLFISIMFLFLLTACSNNFGTATKVPLVIMKTVIVDGKADHSPYKTINKKADIDFVLKLVTENGMEKKTEMPEGNPDYGFYFDHPEAKAVFHDLWIISDKKAVIGDSAGYIELSEADSVRLYKIFGIEF
jgi:hypothetical protein